MGGYLCFEFMRFFVGLWKIGHKKDFFQQLAYILCFLIIYEYTVYFTLPEITYSTLYVQGHTAAFHLGLYRTR